MTDFDQGNSPMTDNDLVDKFANACLRAGKSNSGLCISSSAGPDWEDMQKLRAEIKQRLADLRKNQPASPSQPTG